MGMFITASALPIIILCSIETIKFLKVKMAHVFIYYQLLNITVFSQSKQLIYAMSKFFYF